MTNECLNNNMLLYGNRRKFCYLQYLNIVSVGVFKKKKIDD